jgi:spore coat polysaccharide biosynthesis protein SpsF
MVAIITQARMNSNRLPNKIFLEAAHHPFLYYHVERLRKTGLPVIVATTDNGSEKQIVDFCNANNLPCFCGDEQNVLKRFYKCAKKYKLHTIIRVTSDCPLIDAAIIAKGLEAYKRLNNNCIYYSNAIVRTYPRGMDYEIFSFPLLEEAYINATEDSDKEHVTPYIWKNRSGRIIIKNDTEPEDNSNLRITLDTAEDHLLLTRLMEEYNANDLDANGIIKVLKDNPELININKLVEQKKVK